jgi:hypothetical protein
MGDVVVRLLMCQLAPRGKAGPCAEELGSAPLAALVWWHQRVCYSFHCTPSTRTSNTDTSVAATTRTRVCYRQSFRLLRGAIRVHKVEIMSVPLLVLRFLRWWQLAVMQTESIDVDPNTLA